jgi:hypothetical protein
VLPDDALDTEEAYPEAAARREMLWIMFFSWQVLPDFWARPETRAETGWKGTSSMNVLIWS